jgi:ComF family protein
MTSLHEIKYALQHLLYPQVCSACGNDVHTKDSQLCIRCLASLPETGFECHPENPVEKIFWGRIPIIAATAQFYFTKESMIQHLMHLFKYKGNKELGLQLGRIMGQQLLKTVRFNADGLVPLPLHPAKERKRGYNQASILCQGMAEIMRIPVMDKLVERPTHTETQTHKGRIERWSNMEGKFIVNDRVSLNDRHLLLVDDVITTGATLESCGTALLEAGNSRLSIATLCVAAR